MRYALALSPRDNRSYRLVQRGVRHGITKTISCRFLMAMNGYATSCRGYLDEKGVLRRLLS